MSSWYQTNFRRGSQGNMLPYGKKHLLVSIPGAKWMAARLSMKRPDGSYKVIQIDQTGAPRNPWKDIIQFEMVKISGDGIVPMERGEYRITLRAKKRSVVGIRDRFYIQ